jgi:hypothetical protein
VLDDELELNCKCAEPGFLSSSEFVASRSRKTTAMTLVRSNAVAALGISI